MLGSFFENALCNFFANSSPSPPRRHPLESKVDELNEKIEKFKEKFETFPQCPKVEFYENTTLFNVHKTKVITLGYLHTLMEYAEINPNFNEEPKRLLKELEVASSVAKVYRLLETRFQGNDEEAVICFLKKIQSVSFSLLNEISLYELQKTDFTNFQYSKIRFAFMGDQELSKLVLSDIAVSCEETKSFIRMRISLLGNYTQPKVNLIRAKKMPPW